MNKIMKSKKLLSLVSALSVLVLSVAGSASADFTAINSTTGYNSLNLVLSSGTTTFTQTNTNTQMLLNMATVNPITGFNQSNGNSGYAQANSGAVAVLGGFDNQVNLNGSLQIGNFGEGTFLAENELTGALSTNIANSLFSNDVDVRNRNYADIDNDVKVKAVTGHNQTNYNTGGWVGINSGDALAAVFVSNEANANMTGIGFENGEFNALAGNTLTGYQSYNQATSQIDNDIDVRNRNYANIDNDVDIDLDTGHNKANYNTGGEVSVDTGSAVGIAEISNDVNSNATYVGGGGGDSVLVSLNKKTGAFSYNDANSSLANDIDVKNTNYADIDNDVDIDSNTGHNKANFNTGGDYTDPSITTGDAQTGVIIENGSAGLNVNETVIGGPTGPTALLSANQVTGANSTNTADATLTNDIDVTNKNNLYLTNDVDVDSNTGHNQTSYNTGDASVQTGDADTAVLISNDANVNQTEISGPGPVYAAAANEVTGANSTNTANSTLTNDITVTNTNTSNITNDVDVDNNTGNNQANYNTGSASVSTGSSTVLFGVETTGNVNVTEVGY